MILADFTISPSLQLSARFCLVCHRPVNTEYDALKPYICSSELCAYRFYHYGRGPSLEVGEHESPVKDRY